MARKSSEEVEHAEALSQVLQRYERRACAMALVGAVLPDRNLDGHYLIVTDKDSYYSVPAGDIIEVEGASLDGHGQKIWIRRNSRLWYASRRSPEGSRMIEEIERTALFAPEVFVPPPPYWPRSGDPDEGTSSDQQQLKAGKTIEGAAKLFARECAGGDEYDNNCAHFLSNAFILAGFDELRSSHACIENGARCATSAKRPVRARNMWCWFKEKAARRGTTVSKNTGIWAVFQLDEPVYWGGHVAIIDSDRWKFYGTGWYSDWNQYSYQW
jgi:hypothetical protein